MLGDATFGGTHFCSCFVQSSSSIQCVPVLDNSGIITAGTERWHQCRLLTSQVLDRALQAVGICQTDGVRF